MSAIHPIPPLRELSLRACLRLLPSYSHDRENINNAAAQILSRIDSRLPDAIPDLLQTASLGTSSSQPETNIFQAILNHPEMEQMRQEVRLIQPSLLYLLEMMQRGKKLVHAALNNNLELVRTPLESGSVLESDRGLAVRHAALNDHLVMIEALLGNGPISESDRGRAVILAAFNDNFQITEILLKNGPISQKDRNEALISAHHNQNVSLFGLISTYRIRPAEAPPHSPPHKRRKTDH